MKKTFLAAASTAVIANVLIATASHAQSEPRTDAPAAGSEQPEAGTALPEVTVTQPADNPPPAPAAAQPKPKPKPAVAAAKPKPKSALAAEAIAVEVEAAGEASEVGSAASVAGRASASPGRALRNATTAGSTVSSEAIESYGVSNAYEALIGTPNLTPAPAGGEFLPPIRGENTNGPSGLGGGTLFNTYPTAPLIIDDVARLSSIANNTFQSAFDVEYVEVLRGPQLAVPGALGFAGAYIVKTKAPVYDFETNVFSEITWNDISGSTYRVAGMTNVPVVANEFAVRLVAEYEDGNADFVVADPIPGNPFGQLPAPPGTNFDELNDFDAIRLRGKALLTPSEVPGLSVLVTGEYEQGLDQIFGSFVNNPDLTGRPIEDRIYAYGNQQILDTESWTVIVNTAYQLGANSEIRSITSYVREDLQTNPKSSATYISYDAIEEDRIAQDFVYSFGSKLTANGVAGVTIVENRRQAEVSGFSISQDNELSSQAIYADTSTPIGDGWRLLAGGRIHRHDNSVQSRYFGGFGVVDFEDETVKALPKAGLSYDLSAQETITASVRKGYNPGGSTISFATLTAYEWQDETVWTYELSYRAALPAEGLSFTATAFYNDFTNKQFYLTTIAMDTIILNEPKAESYGLELEGRARVTDAFDVFGGVGLLHTEVTEISPATRPDIEGNEFGLDPSLTFLAGAAWRPFKGFELSGKITYVAEYFGDFENDPLEISGDYVTADIAASYSWNGVTARAFVNNVTDEFAVFQALSDSGAYVLPPRTFGTSLNVKF